MICRFLVTISFLISSAYGAMSVPSSYLVGIGHMLPANYHQLFTIEDKASNDYVVLAHQTTVDLLHSAEEARKAGNLLLNFRYLRLTNYLFPHRGDVSAKFHRSAQEIVQFLNSDSACNDIFESLLRELKTSFPQRLTEINETHCDGIVSSVKDISLEVLSQEATRSEKNETFYRKLEEKYQAIMLKKNRTEEETVFINRQSLEAFTGHLRFSSIHIDENRSKSLRVSFELLRSHQIIPASMLEEDALKKHPLKLTASFFLHDRVETYPVTLEIASVSSFNVWLKTFNSFLFATDTAPIFYKNQLNDLRFKAKDLTLNLDQINQLDIHGLPPEVLKKVKKVVIW